MQRLWNSVIGLLLVTGALLGLTPPIAKLAVESGISAVTWAFVVSGGAGSVLTCVQLARCKLVGLTPHKLRYYAIAAAISYAIPNVLVFTVIPHHGASYTAIMFTLSPVITLMLSIVLGVRRFNLLNVAGIAVGFVGALMVAVTRGEAGQPADLFWVAMGLLIPLSLAVGNIYRTMDWPHATGPTELAAGSHVAAAVMLLVTIVLMGNAGSFVGLAEVPLLVAVQVTAASAMFAFFFRLQAVGGPVYLSQIGYVAAAVGLFAGVTFLGERYALLTWIGAAIIACGIVMTTKASGRDEK